MRPSDPDPSIDPRSTYSITGLHLDSLTSRHVFTLKTLLIVYHSLTGGARQMAEAARRGAASEAEVEVLFLRAAEAGGEDVLRADGYVWVTPENLAAMSGDHEGLLRPHLLRGARPHRGAPVRDAGVRGQRRRERGAPDRAHLHRLAPEARSRSRSSSAPTRRRPKRYSRRRRSVRTTSGAARRPVRRWRRDWRLASSE